MSWHTILFLFLIFSKRIPFKRNIRFVDIHEPEMGVLVEKTERKGGGTPGALRTCPQKVTIFS